MNLSKLLGLSGKETSGSIFTFGRDGGLSLNVEKLRESQEYKRQVQALLVLAGKLREQGAEQSAKEPHEAA